MWYYFNGSIAFSHGFIIFVIAPEVDSAHLFTNAHVLTLVSSKALC